MSDLKNRLKNLTPEQKALLEKKLREKVIFKTSEEKIDKRADQNSYPMSFEQKRLWFLNQLNPQSPFYNIPAFIKIKGKLNKNLLEKSLCKVFTRHQILNAIFNVKENEAVQSVIEMPKSLIEEVFSKDITEIVSNVNNIVFNLSEGPLYKIKFITTKENEHILILLFHHIIIDGWSINIIINEVISYYKNLNKDSTFKLEELPIQYFDYSDWQLRSFKEGKFNAQLEYWKKKLENLPSAINLPIDKKRPSIQTFNGNRIEFEIPIHLFNSLKQIAIKNSISTFMLFLSAFQILLMKFTGEEDFAIGIPSANRKKSETQKLVGFFVNSLVIRSSFSLNSKIEDVFQITKQNVLEAFNNQEIPFDKVAEALQKERTVSHSPLFQVMFDYQENPLKSISLDNLSFELLDYQMPVAKFELLLTIQESANKINASFEYNSDLFFEQSIINLSEVYLKILESISYNHKVTVLDLNCTPTWHLNKILSEWNNTTTNYPKDKTVVDLFSEVISQYPDNFAIEFNEDKITYKELDYKSNLLAIKLSELGAVKGDRIAIYLNQSVEMVISMVSILKIGCVYVPIDIAYPIERIKYMIEDTEAEAVITDNILEVTLKDINNKRIIVDQLNFNESFDKSKLPKVHLSSEDPAYIIYTSGSTGKPKGVIIPHKGIVRLVRNTNYVEIFQKDIIAQISNASFDAATFEIWGSLLNGAKLCIIKKELILSNIEFYNIIRIKNISLLFITTSLFNQYAKFNNKTFSILRSLFFGGEVSDPEAVKLVFENCPNLNIYHVYGPTESTTFTTFHKIVAEDFNKKSLPIGKPISNSTTYITDQNYNLIPIGFPGELLIGGDGLAIEYFKSPELSKEKFINIPQLSDSKRVYRSGDLARFLHDGSIEFIGRLDNQVKLRGFRIELGEIESAIKSIPEVLDSTVIIHGNTAIDKKLIAYFVSREHIEDNKFKNHLGKLLPEFMIPSVFIKMDRIPLNPNGKIDKNLLPKPENLFENKKTKYISPRNSLERYFVGIWEEILNLKKVGIYDNFFEIGGNSLKAAILMNRIQQDFKVSAHVSSIFKVPTIAEFCNYVAEYYPNIILEYFSDSKELFNPFNDLQIDNHIKIDEEKINTFKNLINPLIWQKRTIKNPKAIFILSPPRTGSTLLRVMLAGNKHLFSPPELDLLSFNSLTERRDFFLSNKLDIWLESSVRAIMELKDCDVENAKKIMSYYEDINYSCIEFFSELQTWAGEKILVDKSPSYALDIEILNRLEEDFDEPYYIHLLRNPYAMIYSFIEAKLDKQFFKYNNPFTRRELAELIWLISNENILRFKEQVPENRFFTLKFEELLTDPYKELNRICLFLNIPFQEEMLKPYSGRKMTDGITPEKQMVGDFKFYLRNKIDDSVIDKWKNVHKSNFIGVKTFSIAKKLGYEFEETIYSTFEEDKNYSIIKRFDRKKELPLSSSQQRLWFLEHFEGPNPNYNISSSIEITGDFNVKIFEHVINKLIEVQEILRTCYKTFDGKPKIVIEEEYNYKIDYVDISNKSNTDKEIILDGIMHDEAAKVFDISKLPLFRFKVVKKNEDTFILVITMHHIISDGWSMQIFINELVNAYEKMINHNEISLSKPNIQYVDYAAWSLEHLTGEELRVKIDYWNKKLSNSPPLSTFPLNKPRPNEQRHIGKRIYFKLDANYYDLINNLSKQESATSFLILLTIYSVCLARYSNQKDILIGIPIAQRDNKEIENLIGFFVNTIVIRVIAEKKYTFKNLLTEVKNSLLEAFEYKDMPFEKLLELMQIDRNMSYPPIFQTMFAYNTTTLENVSVTGLKLKPINLDTKTSKFDLTFEVTERKSDYKIAIEFNTDLYDDQYIYSLIENFKNLTKELLMDISSKIFTKKLISIEESSLIDIEFGKEILELKNEENFVSLFEKSVLQYSETVAVEYLNDTIIFNELNLNANKIANYLISLGIKKEDRVGIILDRSIKTIEIIIGILKAGAAYIPIDPSYPIERIEYILEDSKPSVLITESKYRNLRYNSILFLDESIRKIESCDSADPNVSIFGENLAYIIYTSGSTGTPKGVAVQHNSLLNLFYSLNKYIYEKYLDQNLRISLNAPLQFDASVQQIIQLINGFSLVIIPQEIKNDISELKEFIINRNLNVLDCVPSQLKLLFDTDLFSRKSSLKICLPGGEAINQELWDKCNNTKDVLFYNMYGPTECTVDTVICDINKFDYPNLGKGILNTNILILDDYLNKVPLNVQGEIYISDIPLARGYFNRPDKTAEKFIPNPYGSYGSRIYKTGDLAKIDMNRNLIFLGRSDYQVKVRGFRIELEEIEQVLKAHDQIKDAIVSISDDENKRIIAYVIPEKEEIKDQEEIKNYLKTFLPEYMIPHGFMFLESFPLSPNGKIDRRKLPQFEYKRNNTTTDFILPSTENEIILADIWKKLLKVENISVKDNFFELGGDSISSIQLVSECRKKGIIIKPKLVFQFPTIEGILANADFNYEINAEQGLLTGEFQLSPIQLWFFEQKFENPNHWNQSLLIEINDRLDLSLLEKTVQLLLQQHDVLRSKFFNDNGIWKQEYLLTSSNNNFFIEEISDKNFEIIENICNKYQKSLNIFNGELIKFVLIKTQKLPYYLFIVVHHLVIDGVSWRILLSDFEEIYSNLLKTIEINLLAKTSSYRQWNNYNSNRVKEGKIKDELAFWNNQIEEMKDVRQIRVKENLEMNSRIYSYEINESLTAKILSDANKSYNTEPHEIILTSFIIAIKNFFKQNKIALTLESHGRNGDDDNIDLSKTIGWFTSIYPLVFNFNGLTELHEHLIYVKDTYRSVPEKGRNFGYLKYLLKPTNGNVNLVNFDLPGVSFNYLGKFSNNPTNLDYKISSIHKGNERGLENHRTFYIDFSASVIGEKLIVHWLYCNKMFEEEIIKNLNDDFTKNLKLLVEQSLNTKTTILSSSDFLDVKIDNDQLDDIISELNN